MTSRPAGWRGRPTPEPTPELDVVRLAAALRNEADQRLRARVADAVTAGVPIAHVANAAGVTRATIYAWIEARPDA